MKRRVMSFSRLFCALGIMVLSSCRQECISSRESGIILSLQPCCSGTKSGLLPDQSRESRIENWYVFACRDGEIKYLLNNTGSNSITTHNGETWNFYAVANVAANEWDYLPDEGDAESAVESMAIRLSTGQPQRTGIPMAGTVSGYVVSGGGCVAIPLERLFAKYNIRIDRSEQLSTFVDINSIMVRQVHTKLWPFNTKNSVQDQSVLQGWQYYDYASSSDIERLNNGETISLYVPENPGGTVPGISSSLQKTPSRLGSNSGRYAFLEMAGEVVHPLQGGAAYEKIPTTYKCYLGENDTDDFNIIRNKEYNIALSYTDEGCWRFVDFRSEPDIDGSLASIEWVADWTVGSEDDYGVEAGIPYRNLSLNLPYGRSVRLFCTADGGEGSTLDFNPQAVCQDISNRYGCRFECVYNDGCNMSFILESVFPAAYSFNVPVAIRNVFGKDGVNMSGSLTVHAQGDYGYSLDSEPFEYVGQKKKIRITTNAAAGSIDAIHPENAEGISIDIQRVDRRTLDIEIGAYDEGTATIWLDINGTRSGSPIVFTTRYPRLYFDKNAYSLHESGAASAFVLRYKNDEGQSLNFDREVFEASLGNVSFTFGSWNGTLHSGSNVGAEVSMDWSSGSGVGSIYTTNWISNWAFSGNKQVFAYPSQQGEEHFFASSYGEYGCANLTFRQIPSNVSDTFHNWAAVMPSGEFGNMPREVFDDILSDCPDALESVQMQNASDANLLFSVENSGPTRRLTAHLRTPDSWSDTPYLLHGRNLPVNFTFRHLRSGVSSTRRNFLTVILHLGMGLYGDVSPSYASCWSDFYCPSYPVITSGTSGYPQQLDRRRTISRSIQRYVTGATTWDNNLKFYTSFSTNNGSGATYDYGGNGSDGRLSITSSNSDYDSWRTEYEGSFERYVKHVMSFGYGLRTYDSLSTDDNDFNKLSSAIIETEGKNVTIDGTIKLHNTKAYLEHIGNIQNINNNGWMDDYSLE